CVGALCPRKNLAAAVAAFSRARELAGDLSLALVGEPARGWESDPARREIEAAGEAAILVDPDRPGETDAALERVLGDEACARRLRELGRARALQFTWERT